MIMKIETYPKKNEYTNKTADRQTNGRGTKAPKWGSGKKKIKTKKYD